uniref:Retrotransposon gag domain-containing protein n=1 Tax=Tanacetum cinerariifolium TaxID=118510 RepID=A0A6L2LD03_TANCI|nr:hypothetical protein [Tanacetum cinerariifolium]
MADQCTMAELLRAPTEGYAEAIMVPPILAEQFELKHSLINMMNSDQFFRLEKDNPHDHIRWFNKITSTIKYKDVLNSAIKLMLFPFSLAGATRRWLEKEPPRSILTREDLVSKFINEFFPPPLSRTINLRNEISHFQQLFDESFHEAWDRYKELLRACPHHASVKAVEEICVTCGGAHPYYQCLAAVGNTFPELRDNIQGYVAVVVVNYNQGNSVYHPLASMSNQTNELKNMMASFFQMNIASTSWLGSLPNNTVANPKGELKAITTRSGIVLDGPSVPIPPPFITSEKDEHVKETLTDQDLSEYTIKVPPPLVLKSKSLSQRDFVVHQRDLLHPNIPYPSRTLKQKQQEKDEEKLQGLANTPLNQNCSAVILKKLPEKLGDPEKSLIPCGFNELKCKALADLGASINLMPLSVWKKLGLLELISTRITLELANRAICTPAGIPRDVFVLVGKFTFPADFVIVDYESDPRVPLILGRPFLRNAHALIDVHGEEMILRDGDERLTLNMRHDTSRYSNQPQKESINLINVFNDSNEDFLEDLFSTNQPSGNPTFSSHPGLTSPKVKDDNFDPEGGNVLPEKLLDLDSTEDLHSPHQVNQLSGSTTYSSSLAYLLEEFADELALITFPPGNNDLYLKDLIDQSNLADLNDNLVDSMPDEHAFDYSSPPLYDKYDDDLFEVESDTENVYDDPFDSKGSKTKSLKS